MYTCVYVYMLLMDSLVLDFSVSFSSTAAAETLVDQITNTTLTSFSQTYIDTYGNTHQSFLGNQISTNVETNVHLCIYSSF